MRNSEYNFGQENRNINQEDKFAGEARKRKSEETLRRELRVRKIGREPQKRKSKTNSDFVSVEPVSNRFWVQNDLPETLPYKDTLEQLADRYRVPAAFLGAVMMAESGGDPAAVGDDGAAVGLFQLHEDGMGHGLGELRLNPELNASIGARGLAEGWHEGYDALAQRRGAAAVEAA